jgi:hypothetical protein
MADNTYQVKVYNKQGGDELVVASAGYINIEDGGYVKIPVVTEVTTANASNFGLSIIETTLEKRTYGLDAPAVGSVKHIHATIVNATGFACIGGSGLTIDVQGTAEQYLKFIGSGGVTLVADTTATYKVVAADSTAGAITGSTSGTS